MMSFAATTWDALHASNLFSPHFLARAGPIKRSSSHEGAHLVMILNPIGDDHGNTTCDTTEDDGTWRAAIAPVAGAKRPTLLSASSSMAIFARLSLSIWHCDRSLKGGLYARGGCLTFIVSTQKGRLAPPSAQACGPRKSRSDAGKIRLTERDVVVWLWIGSSIVATWMSCNGNREHDPDRARAQ